MEDEKCKITFIDDDVKIEGNCNVIKLEFAKEMKTESPDLIEASFSLNKAYKCGNMYDFAYKYRPLTEEEIEKIRLEIGKRKERFTDLEAKFVKEAEINEYAGYPLESASYNLGRIKGSLISAENVLSDKINDPEKEPIAIIKYRFEYFDDAEKDFLSNMKEAKHLRANKSCDTRSFYQFT